MRAIHDGQAPDDLTGAVNVPLYLSSTYAQEEIGKHKGWEYSRVWNPTRDALEVKPLSLEGGVGASGMAAISARVAMLKAVDHVVCGGNVCGGTPRLFNQVVAGYGIEFTDRDRAEPEALRPVHGEMPTNPLMTLMGIRVAADICYERGIELSVDTTFMSPSMQQPIALERIA